MNVIKNILNKLRSRYKIIVSLLILILILFAGYMYKYQQVINEGSAIFEERCLTIDPLIEKHKNLGEEWLKAHPASESAKNILPYSDEYNKSTEELVEKSKLWLDKIKRFLVGWDFQFFTHSVLKDIFAAQYDKYYADYQGNVTYLAYAKDPTNQKLYDGYFEAVKHMFEQDQMLTNRIEAAKQVFDIRSYFTKVPKIRCSEVDDNPGMPSY